MVGFQMFPRSHLNYVFVTKIPRTLILYFTFLKNKDNSSLNTVVIELALYVFFVLFKCFLLFLADSASYQEQAAAHICPVGLYLDHLLYLLHHIFKPELAYYDS